MAEATATPLRVLLYEGPGSEPIESRQRFHLLRSLLEAGYPVTAVSSEPSVTSPDAAPLFVLGRFDEQAPEACQDPGTGSPIFFHEIGELDTETILQAAGEVREKTAARRIGEWTPWFPVIDYDRCTNCMQCLTFCLFDVYGVDEEKKIEVQNQSNCKTNCPACSRVCPEAAILFPKYGKGPINGDVVRDEDLQRESMKVDISALLGGDIYSSLRERSAAARKRFSTERDESRALLERKRCLKKLQKDLDIPEEVLMTLPSAGDIEDRARRAREKMEKRMKRSRSARDRMARPTEEDWGI